MRLTRGRFPYDGAIFIIICTHFAPFKLQGWGLPANGGDGHEQEFLELVVVEVETAI